MVISARDLLLGPADMSPFRKGAITLACMSASALLGFYVQQRLIEKYYSGEKAELMMRVREIKRRELLEIARQGGGEAAAAALPVERKGESALLGKGGSESLRIQQENKNTKTSSGSTSS